MSLKLFGFVDVDGGSLSRRLAIDISKYLTGSKKHVLMVDGRNGHGDGNDYFQFGSLGSSCVTMDLTKLSDEFLASVESEYDLLLILVRDHAKNEISCSVNSIPITVIIQIENHSSIKRSKSLVKELLDEKMCLKPAAFATNSGNRLLEARLARGLCIPSWGEINDIERISERVLNRSSIYDGNRRDDPVSKGVIVNSKPERGRAEGGSRNYGPLEAYIEDPTITEIMVNGSDEIYIERGGSISKTNTRFKDDEEVLSLVERMVSMVNRRIDESSPMVDARMNDGSRLNAAISPISIDGPVLTIRRFIENLNTVDDLISLGMMTREVCNFISECVRRRISIVISGGTSSGKTTLLGILASLIPKGERIITIEDSAELSLMTNHVVRLEARPPNIEGAGEVTIRQLVKNALRMRPDRIVVGECRGGEALDMLQAMNTGHEGSLTTVHANSARDAISRLETMVLMANEALPLRAIRQQIVSSVKMIIHLARDGSGTRYISQIAELTGQEGDTPSMQILAETQNGDPSSIRLTGLKPKFFERA